MQHRKSVAERAAEHGFTVLDGGKSRRAPRLLLREGIAGCIAKRPYGHPVKTTKKMYDVAEGYWKKRNPLGSIEKLIGDACRVRDAVPAEMLAAYDLQELYGRVQGSVAVMVAQGIDASNARREQQGKGGAA